MKENKKYSDEFKMELVRKYLDGKSGGYVAITKKYGIHKSMLQKWVALYREGGIDFLINTNHLYSGEFKVSVVEYMQKNSLSLRKTAAHFGIKYPGTITRWERVYTEKGKDALLEERYGGPKKMSKTQESYSNNDNTKKNKELLAEVQHLRMENEYLKKLIALTQERERQEQKTK